MVSFRALALLSLCGLILGCHQDSAKNASSQTEVTTSAVSSAVDEAKPVSSAAGMSGKMKKRQLELCFGLVGGYACIICRGNLESGIPFPAS